MKQEYTTIARTSEVVLPLVIEDSKRSPEKNKEPYLLVACIVLHSHLDYAWWRRRQSSQIREAKLIDGIVDALSANKIQSFTLEQAIAAKEYVRDLRRDRREEFARLCQEQRFEMIGAEIQQEIFLSDEEAFFWNVNYGHATWAALGGRPSTAFYQPDTFGVPRSFAKMLRHAGYDNFIYQRGHGEEVRTHGAVMLLTSDDGSSVYAVPMPDGYSSINKLGRWRRNTNGTFEDLKDQPGRWYMAAAEHLDWMLDTYVNRYKQIDVHYMLLGGGSDFEAVDLDLLTIVEQAEMLLKEKYPHLQCTFTTFEEYIEAVKCSVDPAKLHSFCGELRSAAEQNVLRGIDSTRISLKQAVDRTEREIKNADALLALALLRRKYAPASPTQRDLSVELNAMFVAKERLLPVYSHDSISGCGTDDASRDMAARTEDVYDYAMQITRNNLAYLASASKEEYFMYPRYGETISVVNPLGYRRSSLVEIPMQESRWKHIPHVTAEMDGQHIPVQLVERNGQKFLYALVDIAGFSAKHIHLQAAEPPQNKQRAESDTCIIANEFYQVEAQPDGTVKITDKRSRTESTAHIFEDQADRGDEYNFDAVNGDQKITNVGQKARVRVLSEGSVFSELEIELDMLLPEGLQPDRQSRSEVMVHMPVRTVVRLAHGIDRVDFTTTLTNNARDHRLRVRMETPHAGETIRAKEPYEVIERPIVPVQGGEDWCEPLPTATSHQQGMLAAGDALILSHGLPEYEAIPDQDGNIGEVALTLLRCVGWLSRDDLRSRKREAGPIAPVEEAQLLGEHTFEYSFSMNGKKSNHELLRMRSDYRQKLEVGPPHVDLTGILHIEGSGFEIAALAPSWDRTGAMLRVYNPNDHEATIHFTGMFQTAQRCNGREIVQDPANIRSLTLKKGEIATIKFS